MTYNFSDNIQRGILFLYKSNLNFFYQTLSLIKDSYFACGAHQAIFKGINSYYQKYKSLPNDDFIKEEVKLLKLKNIDLNDVIDELIEINALSNDYVVNPGIYLDLTEKFAKQEAMKHAILESIERIKDDDYGAVEDLVKKALLVNRHVDLGHNYFSSVNQRYKNKDEDNKDKFATVLPTITENLEGGNARKELAIVAAMPGGGKSLYLVNQAVTTMMAGKKVLYISLEMSEEKIAARFDSIISRLPINSLKSSLAITNLEKRLEKFKKIFKESDLRIKQYPTGLATVQNIRTLLHNLENHENFVPDLIIVDYLELLRPMRNIDAEYAAQQRIAEELRGLAIEHDVLVWTATQPNREGKKVSVITDAQLADSFGKIRIADFAISINQTDEEYDNGEARVYIMKARDAKQRYLVKMKIDYTTLVMSEAQHGDMMEEATLDTLQVDALKMLESLSKQQGAESNV